MAINGEDVNDVLDRIEDRLGRVEKKLDGLQIQFEDVREDIKKLGEGYEQGLKEITRQVANFGSPK